MPPTLYIAIALLAVVVVRQFSHLIAAGLGIAIALGVGVWGLIYYQRGDALTFLGVSVPLTAFFLFIAVLIALEGLNLHLALKKRRGNRTRQQEKRARDEF